MLEYADDRPWPGATGWSDAASRSNLDVLASGVEHLTGFAVSCINVVHRGTLRTVAMHAPLEQRELLMDSHTPVEVMEDALARGDVWGRFTFVPAGSVHDASLPGVTFDVAPVDFPDAWQTDDVLAAAIRNDRGEMVGMVAVDLPVTGRQPGADERRRLERYAELVEGAVVMALDHDEQQERLTMARAARDVVTAATRELSMAAVFAESAQALMAGFGARGVWLQTFELGESHGAVHADSGVVRAVPPGLVEIAERVARQAWSEQRVGSLSRTDRTRQLAGHTLEHETEAILDHLATIGIGSILFVPIGVGVECLGCLVLSRGSATHRWTDAESEAARDIGMDLGRAILNARAYEREQRAVAELQALDSYKSQLVATLSHELKTPLTSILGNLEMLQDEVASPADRRRGISAIGRGATRLADVVEDLMLLAKVGDPGNRLITRPVDLAELAGDVVDLTAPLARQRGLLVVLDVAAPVVIMGDATELDRVLGNLLTNAIKYTSEGGRVTLRVERRGDDAVVTCTDTGIGIGDADLPRLFGEFFRSADPSAQRQPGTGLGLAIVHSIVRRHGGRVQVESTPGVGSTFTVSLPAAATSATRGVPELTRG